LGLSILKPRARAGVKLWPQNFGVGAYLRLYPTRASVIPISDPRLI